LVALPELLGVSSLGPLDVAVELGGSGRQDEELQGTLLADALAPRLIALGAEASQRGKMFPAALLAASGVLLWMFVSPERIDP